MPAALSDLTTSMSAIAAVDVGAGRPGGHFGLALMGTAASPPRLSVSFLIVRSKVSNLASKPPWSGSTGSAASLAAERKDPKCCSAKRAKLSATGKLKGPSTLKGQVVRPGSCSGSKTRRLSNGAARIATQIFFGPKEAAPSCSAASLSKNSTDTSWGLIRLP